MKTAEGIINERLLQEFTIGYQKSDVIKAFEEYAQQFKHSWYNAVSNPPQPESSVLVKANGGSKFIMYYGLDNSGNNSWFYKDEVVRPYMFPTEWMQIPE